YPGTPLLYTLSLHDALPISFPHYTLHDTGHSFRIMEYMSKLVGDISRLSELEVSLMIYSALLHDIGMAVSEDDVVAIKSDSFPLDRKSTRLNSSHVKISYAV